MPTLNTVSLPKMLKVDKKIHKPKAENMLYLVNFLRIIARFTAFQVVFTYCSEEVRKEPVYVEVLLEKKCS